MLFLLLMAMGATGAAIAMSHDSVSDRDDTVRSSGHIPTDPPPNSYTPGSYVYSSKAPFMRPRSQRQRRKRAA